MASQEQTSSPSQKQEPPKKQKGAGGKFIIVAIIAVVALCACAAAAGVAVWLLSETGDPDGNLTTSETDNDPTSYMGFEYSETELEDNTDVQLAIDNMYENMETLYEYETTLADAAASQDEGTFFETYRTYNMTAALVMSQAQALSDFYAGSESEDMSSLSPFISPAYAKERSSWWYYVPIIGSLVKAKHQSIERARAGVYDYLKNEVEAVDRDSFLQEYGLDSIEDLRNAPDGKVEQLARDPELRAGIDWTAVATDLGEQAVLATVEGYKIGASGSPVTTAAVNGGMRIFTKKGDAVADQIPPEQDRVTLAVPQSLKDAVDDAASDAAGTSWTYMSWDQRDAIASALADATITASVHTTGMDDAEQISLPADTYDILTVTDASTPVIITDVSITGGETIELTVDYYDLSQYALDDDIAITLGFDATADDTDFEANTCTDLGYDLDEYNAATCETAYESCNANPYVYDDGYSTCIGADGGCWDIGRWEYVNEGNCPIDADNNLDYSDTRLQDDYEYFGGGNRAYCECIVECREEHTTEKDCVGDLETCCSGAQ